VLQITWYCISTLEKELEIGECCVLRYSCKRLRTWFAHVIWVKGYLFFICFLSINMEDLAKEHAFSGRTRKREYISLEDNMQFMHIITCYVRSASMDVLRNTILCWLERISYFAIFYLLNVVALFSLFLLFLVGKIAYSYTCTGRYTYAQFTFISIKISYPQWDFRPAGRTKGLFRPSARTTSFQQDPQFPTYKRTHRSKRSKVHHQWWKMRHHIHRLSTREEVATPKRSRDISGCYTPFQFLKLPWFPFERWAYTLCNGCYMTSSISLMDQRLALLSP
jgi:hypothetical protein